MKKEAGYIDGNLLGAIFYGVILVIFVSIASCTTILKNGNKHIVKATVSEKTVKRNGQSEKYLIFTDVGVYENTDSLLRGKWNSSDFYGQIKLNETYKFTVVGYRVPFLSWYENIIEISQE